MIINEEKRKAIEKIVKRYDVFLISCTANIQWTFDVILDRRIWHIAKRKMEAEIRNLGNINDIIYLS